VILNFERYRCGLGRLLDVIPKCLSHKFTIVRNERILKWVLIQSRKAADEVL